jgi:hypothetical protein
MWGMEKPESVSIEETILERLTNAEDRDKIIMDLCELKDMNWAEAQAMVESIEKQKKDQIVLAQSPVLVLIALVTFIGGFVLIGISVYDIIIVYNTYASAKIPASAGFLLYLFTYGGFFWELALLGIAMIVGSLRGMQDIWLAFFEKIGLFPGSEQ